MALLTLMPQQLPSNLEPEATPSISAAPHHNDAIFVQTIPEAFAAARDFLTLSVLVSLALEALILSVPVNTGEPAGSLQHSIPCQPHVPLTACSSVLSKGKTAMLASLGASPPCQQMLAPSGTVIPWSAEGELSSKLEIGSYISHPWSCSLYSSTHFHHSMDLVTGVPLRGWSGAH